MCLLEWFDDCCFFLHFCNTYKTWVSNKSRSYQILLSLHCRVWYNQNPENYTEQSQDHWKINTFKQRSTFDFSANNAVTKTISHDVEKRSYKIQSHQKKITGHSLAKEQWWCHCNECWQRGVLGKNSVSPKRTETHYFSAIDTNLTMSSDNIRQTLMMMDTGLQRKSNLSTRKKS